MSVAEFSAALRNKALQAWFKNELAGGGSASAAAREKFSLENINVLANPVGIYRSGEQTSEKTAFIITRDTVKDLVASFHNIDDPKLLEELADMYFSSFRSKDSGVQVSRKKITVGNNLPAIYFPNISFDAITKLVNNIMNIKPGQLAKYYEKGHVIGITTELLQATSERIKAVDTKGSTGKSFLLSQLDKVIDYYRRLDLESANIQPAGNVAVYASVNKSISKKGSTRYLVELQPKAANQKSAKEVQATIGSIRKLFSPSNLSENTILGLIEKLQESVSDPKFQQDLLSMKSSPSYKDMIAKHIAGILNGVPIDQQFVHKNVKVASKKVPTPDLSKLRSEIKKEINKAKAVKNKIQSAKPKTHKESFSPSSFQLLLNSALSDRIKKNMGTGSRKDILNLRSGRFAESVDVTKVTVGRQGMLTAYYTYMKYPYATFSEGGRQQYPRSRDPKLLISRTLREIAAEHAITNMRSVLV